MQKQRVGESSVMGCGIGERIHCPANPKLVRGLALALTISSLCLQREGNIVEYYVLFKFNALKVFQLFRFRTEQTSQLA